MSYQICKRCNTMFLKNGKVYCNSCSEINDRDFELILTHIKTNPKATVLDIITETSVSLKSIDCFVEEGGIVYVESKPDEAEDERESTKTNNPSVRKERFHLRR